MHRLSSNIVHSAAVLPSQVMYLSKSCVRHLSSNLVHSATVLPSQEMYPSKSCVRRHALFLRCYSTPSLKTLNEDQYQPNQVFSPFSSSFLTDTCFFLFLFRCVFYSSRLPPLVVNASSVRFFSCSPHHSHNRFY